MASGKKIIGDKLTEFSLRDKRNNTREREWVGWIVYIWTSKRSLIRYHMKDFFLNWGKSE